MSYAMLSVETVLKAANAALNAELKPEDLEGLNHITRLNLLAALALAAQAESPPVTSMAISPDDFALLSAEWNEARKPGRRPTRPGPKLVASNPTKP